MRSASMSTLINLSVNRTKLILFQPFNYKKWLKLLFIAWLSGAISGGCSGGGGNFGDDDQAAVHRHLRQEDSRVVFNDVSREAKVVTVYAQGGTDTPPEARNPAGPEGKQSPKAAVFVIAITVIFTLGIVLLFMWLGSRFIFIWYESIVANTAFVSEPWGRYKSAGNSLFKFWVMYFLISLAAFSAIVAWGVFSAVSAGVSFNQTIEQIGGAGFLFKVLGPQMLAAFILFVLCVIFWHLVSNFTVVVMAMDSESFWPSWGRTCNVISGQVKDLFVYFLMTIALVILTSILAVVAFIIAAIALFLAGLIILGIPFLLFVTLLKAKIIYSVFAVIVGVPYAVVALLVLLCVGLPFAVFFRCFSLYFWTSLDGPYNPLPLILEESTQA